MSHANTVILGGGLAGLSAAYHLNGEAALYEKQSSLGGLCRQVRLDGFRFDVVPHVLHFRHDSTRAFLNELLGGRLASYARQARVYSNGTYTRYPFQAHLFGLPPAVVEECVEERRWAARNGGPDTITFGHWIVSTFGAGIAKHFMIPYNTKFWTLPPSELTCEWLDGLVPVPTIEQTVRGASIDDPSEYGYNVKFWYPTVGGLGAILEAFLERIPRLHLNKRLVRIKTSARRLLFSDGEEVSYARLLSSVPLPELRRLLDPLPPEIDQALDALRWTAITVLHVGVKGSAPVSWHWAYVPDPQVAFYRVGIPSHYAPDAAPTGHHVLSAEVSHLPWRAFDQHALVTQALQDLNRIGLLPDQRAVVVQQPIELRYGYPLYDRNYDWATSRIRSYLNRHGILLIGRFGSWRYLSMEQALLDGQRAASQIVSGGDGYAVQSAGAFSGLPSYR